MSAPMASRPKKAELLHVGPIHSHVAGRTDHLPAKVPNGAYVLPADIVSAMGEGNTMAGFKAVKRMFSGAAYGQSKGPYNSSSGPYNSSGGPYSAGDMPYGGGLPGKADGGPVSGDDGVPVVVAGGEYVLAPHEAHWAGGGDMQKGHRVLDDFVKQIRAETISTLKKLPGPRKD